MQRVLAFLSAIAFVAIVAAAPTPPTLARQFTSNFIMKFGQGPEDDEEAPPAPAFVGFLAVDDVNYGLFANFSGEDILPIYFHTNLVLNPSDGGSTLYWFQDAVCLSSPNVPSYIFQFFPLSIPKTAKYIGNSVINGTTCTAWSWNFTLRAFAADVPAIVTLYAASTPQAGGTAVVQVTVRANYGDHGVAFSFRFTDTITGPFSPAIYAPPAGVDCSKSMSGQHNPIDFLLRMVGFLN